MDDEKEDVLVTLEKFLRDGFWYAVKVWHYRPTIMRCFYRSNEIAVLARPRWKDESRGERKIHARGHTALPEEK